MSNFKISRNLPSELRMIYLRLYFEFWERVEKAEGYCKTSDYSKPYYSKWTSTSTIAKYYNIPTAQARLKLEKLEKLGVVHSKHSGNWTTWALNHVEGFKQHEFEDYFCRIEKTN